MILSSTPETNDDPYPWAFSQACSITSQEVWHNNRFTERRDSALLWFPRPEYDRAHEPNPILVEWRESKLDPYELLLVLESKWAARFSWAEIEHARAVIERWLAVFK